MKLLLKFFSNSQNRAYLRGLATEMGESTNAVRIELNRLTEAGLLHHEQEGNTVLYKANTSNPFYKVLHKMVLKYMGLYYVLDEVISKLGKLELAFINGDYSRGIDSGIIDLVLVGNSIDQPFLNGLLKRAEEISKRRIRLLTISTDEFQKLAHTLDIEKALVLWAASDSGYESTESDV